MMTGQISWRRFALLMIQGTAAAAVMVGLTATGSIAASVDVSGSPFKIIATELRGDSLVGFGSVVRQVNGKPHLVFLAGIRNAAVTGLCLSAKMGPLAVVIRAGNGGTTASGQNLVVALDRIGADATLDGVDIGRDASTLTGDPPLAGVPGGFGLQTGRISLKNVQSTSWSVTAGAFVLPGMTITVASHGC